MPSRLTPLALVALAVFAEGPCHAYEVYATMRDRREDRTVKLSAGSLYRAVNAMADAGLLHATGTARAGNRPERTTYAITPAGRELLDRKIAGLIAEPVYEYPRFNVGMAEAHNLPAAEVVRLLGERIAVLDEELDVLAAGTERVRARQLPQRFWFDLDLTLTMTRAERDWCARVRTGLEDGSLDWTALSAPATCAERADDLQPSPLHPKLPPTPRDTRTTEPETRR